MLGLRDNKNMRVTTDFSVIPDQYSKHAPAPLKADGMAIMSFPFYVDQLKPGTQYLHWALVDDDAIPVCGFQWIHWAVANVPVDALMFDMNDAQAVEIPEDFSRMMMSMVPEALCGRNSTAGSMIGSDNPQVYMHYVGPQPPDADHYYKLMVWESEQPLELNQGFWLNQMYHELNKAQINNPAWLYLVGRQ